MKKLTLLLLSMLCTAATAFAYDFQSDDLYYNITSENTVEVTRQEDWISTNYQGLTTATIPATVTYNGTTYSVTSIGDWAFYDCSSHTSITIPNSVTSIGDYAFRNCSSLTSITIPNSVTSIGYGVFEGCSSLPVVDNVRYADTYLVEAIDKSLSTYTIKAGTKWIGDAAFNSCSSLTSVTIPNSVTSIGNSAFYNCSALTSISIPNSVTSIGNWMFCECTSLTSMIVESGNTIYDSRENCNAIIETATNTLIAGCQSTIIPNSVTSIGYAAFYLHSSLSSITIPNSVTSIGDYAFGYCSSLTSITIPYSVTSIGYAAFSRCSSLASVTIPNSVTSIGGYAFGYCSSLTQITCLAQTPPTCGDDCFYGVPRTIPLYVPDEAVEDYKAAAVWQEFNIVAESDAPNAIKNALNTDTKGVQKLLRDGQVLILRNGETYDMMGQRL